MSKKDCGPNGGQTQKVRLKEATTMGQQIRAKDLEQSTPLGRRQGVEGWFHIQAFVEEVRNLSALHFLMGVL